LLNNLLLFQFSLLILGDYLYFGISFEPFLIAIYIILNSFFKEFSFLTLKNTFTKSFKSVQFTPPPLELDQNCYVQASQRLFSKKLHIEEQFQIEEQEEANREIHHIIH